MMRLIKPGKSQLSVLHRAHHIKQVRTRIGWIMNLPEGAVHGPVQATSTVAVGGSRVWRPSLPLAEIVETDLRAWSSGGQALAGRRGTQVTECP